jgi:hypothetical protein
VRALGETCETGLRIAISVHLVVGRPSEPEVDDFRGRDMRPAALGHGYNYRELE